MDNKKLMNLLMTKHEWFNRKSTDKQEFLDCVLNAAIESCYGCPFEGDPSDFEKCLEPECHINEETETTILSFGDPNEWPEIFKRRKE